MPLETIVAIWRVMTDRSPSLIRLAHGSSMSFFARLLSAMSRTIRPLAFS